MKNEDSTKEAMEKIIFLMQKETIKIVKIYDKKQVLTKEQSRFLYLITDFLKKYTKLENGKQA
jgi:hypothetical protein